MLGLRAYQKIFLDLEVCGKDTIPAGAKIYAQNHVSSTDPHWILPLLPEPVHLIVGPGYQSKIVGWILDRFEQINAMPDHRATTVESSVRCLARGGSIYTAPEGDLQEPYALGHFYPGVAKIFRRIQVPIVPVAIVAPREALRPFQRFDMKVEGRVYRAVFVLRGPLCVRFGEPFLPEFRKDVDEKEDNDRIMSELKGRLQVMIDETCRERGWS
jgi:1-acyl-sn-glycerol-3-phosphate acyltransferase